MPICNIPNRTLRNLSDEIIDVSTSYLMEEGEFSNEETRDIKFNNFIQDRLREIGTMYPACAEKVSDFLKKEFDSDGEAHEILKHLRESGVKNLFDKKWLQIKQIIEQSNAVESDWSLDEINTDILYENNGLKYKPNDRFIYKAFGTALNPMQYSRGRINSLLTQACFFNRGMIDSDLGITSTTMDLNVNLEKVQELLFNDVKNYIKYLIGKNTPLPLTDEVNEILNRDLGLYQIQPNGKEATPTNNLAILKNVIEHVFKEFTPDILNKHYSNIKNFAPDNDTRKRSKLTLDAFSSYLFLNNFDSYLKILLGKSIDINPNYFGRRVHQCDKYQIANTSLENLPIWRTSEDINISKEVSNITKLLISSIPMIKWGKKLQYRSDNINDFDETQYLSFSHFQHIIPKIRNIMNSKIGEKIVFDDYYYDPEFKNEKKLAVWNSLDKKTQQVLKGKTLKYVAAEAIENSRENWHAIFKLLTTQQFRNLNETNDIYSAFDLYELDLLNSIAEGVFSGDNSLYRYSNNGKNDYYKYITQTANSIYNVMFTQLYKDDKGEISMRNLQNVTTSNIRASLELNINNANSKYHNIFSNIISDFPKINGSEQIVELKDEKGHVTGIQFMLPNTDLIMNVSYVNDVSFFDGINGKAYKDFDAITTDLDYKTQEKRKRSIIQFIDDILALNLEDEQDLLKFLQEEYKNNENTMYTTLFKFAGRVFGNMYVSNKYIKNLSDYNRISSKVIFSDLALPIYNELNNEINLVSNYDAKAILDKIANAESKLLGLAQAVFVKNAEGNNLSKQTFNRMLGSYQTLFSLKEMQDNSASKHFMILNNNDLFNNIVISEEFQDFNGDSKPYSKMSVAELAHTEFKHAFMSAFTAPKFEKLNSHGKALFYIGVMADRTIFPQMHVNLDAKLVNDNNSLNGKTLRELNSEERDILTKQELGNFYLNVYTDIIDTFDKLDKYIHIRENATIGPNDKPVYTASLSSSFLNNFSEFNKWCKQIGETPIEYVRKVCNEYNNEYVKRNNAYTKQHIERLKDELIEANILLAAQESDWEGFEYDENEIRKTQKEIYQIETQIERESKALLTPIKLTDQIHFKEGENGTLATNKTLLAQLVRYNQHPELTETIRNLNPKDIFQTYEEFHQDQEFGMLKSMLDCNFSIDLNDKSDESAAILSELKRYADNGEGKFVDVVNNFYLAYLSCISPDGEIETIPIRNQTDIIVNKIDLENGTKDNVPVRFLVKLNPLLAQWNDLDFLLTQEFNCATGGSFIAHPDKSKSPITLAQESSQNISNTKRNNVYVSQVDQYDLDNLDGLPSKIKIAVIEEFITKCPTINGQENPTDVTNAATWIHPAFVYLQKNSLSRGEKGVVTKPFVVFKDSNTGSGGEVKTAAFGITNDKMRNMPILKMAFRKLGSNYWDNSQNIDITRNCFTGDHNTWVSQYFRRPKEIMDSDGKKKKVAGYYKILKIEKDQNKPDSYIRYISEVDKYGREIPDSEEIPPEYFNVSTNYELWNLFGGEWSMEYDKNLKRLVGSENSILDVVTAMNNVSDEDYKGYDGIMSQKYVSQPLKQADIGWLTTKEAVKYGAGNINVADKIRDINNTEMLDWFYIDMINSGVQLDKEHSSDNEDIALMTQVINACAARGFTFDDSNDMYRALNTLTEIGLKKFINPLRKYFQIGSEQELNDFKQVITDQVIKTIINGKNNDVAKNLTVSLVEEARGVNNKINFTNLAIPLSDNQLYNRITSTISVFLTDLGIKMRIPGALCVLNPADGIFKLYDGRKYESFIDPETELEEIQQDYITNKAIFDRTKPGKNDPNLASYVRMGRKYLITRDEKNENFNKPTLIETPLDIADIQEECRDGEIIKIVEYIKDGRDLDSYNVWFNEIPQKGKQARKFQMWNLDCMKHLFGLDFIRKEAKNEIEEGHHPLWEELQRIYRAEVGENLNVDLYHFVKPEDELYAFYDAVKQTEKLIRRRQQRELMVLTPDSVNPREQYDVIKEEVNKAYKTYDADTINSALEKYAQWVNIYFTTGNGSKLYLTPKGKNQHLSFQSEGNTLFDLSYVAGVEPQIPQSEWKNFEKHVGNAIDRSNQVLIDGEYVNVNKSSIEIQPYENISSKLNASVFGLEKDIDLNEIKNDENYFIKQSLKNRISPLTTQQYNIELKSDNGKHQYLLLKSCLSESQGLHKLDNIFYERDNEGNRYRVSQNGRRMYDLFDNVDIYSDDNGHEVIVVDDTIQNDEDDNAIDYKQVLQYYIDDLSYNSIIISDNAFTKDKDEFTKIYDVLSNADNVKARLLGNRINFYYQAQGRKGSNSERYSQAFHKLLEPYNSEHNIDPDNQEQFEDWLKKNPTSDVVISGREKYVSFLKSLDNIESRTPAQCMQSFMPCRTVAFDNPDSNNAYVSSYQILIQGSDFDIDTVNVTSFDFDDNGILQMWSPYANLTSREHLDASETLPFPTDKAVQEISGAREVKPLLKFLSDNLNCFTIKEVDKKTGNIPVIPVLSTAEDIVSFGKMLRQSNNLKSIQNADGDILEAIRENYLDYGNLVNTIYLDNLSEVVDKIIKCVDRHNLYRSTLSDRKAEKIANNFLVSKVYKISMSPSNLVQSTESVDGSTEPLKDIINRRHSGKSEGYFGPGNVVAKYQNMNNVLVGKNGVGIYAVSMKVIDGLTQYYNSLLNSGDIEKQRKVLLGRNGKGITINGKTYYTLANIRAMDINTIKDKDVLKALSLVTQDTDAFITTSAMMSLAVDNAKEMKLYQMNANEKTMGLYSYGTAIGVDFDELTNILMSPTGKIINRLADGNLFDNEDGFSTVIKSIGYLNGNYWPQFSKFNKKSVNHLKIVLTGGKKRSKKVGDIQYFNQEFADFVNSHNTKFKKKAEQIHLNNSKSKFTPEFYKFISSTDISLNKKLQILEKARAYRDQIRGKKSEIEKLKMDYNNMIDYLEEYTIQVDAVKNDHNKINDIMQLALGANEFFKIGQMFGYNQGIKTKQADLLRQIGFVESAVYDSMPQNKRKPSDMIDITRFAFDKEYQQQQIEKYEEYKHTTNILDALVSVPHFYGYLQAIAADIKAKESTFKFRSIRKMLPKIKEKTRQWDMQKLYRGIENYLNDYIRNEWLSNNAVIYIPKGNENDPSGEGNWIFDENGNKNVLKSDAVIRLGSDYANATFRAWMERDVIPNIKKGNDHGRAPITRKDNKFIKGLSYSNLNNIASGNKSSVMSLKIEMSPRTEHQEQVLSTYIGEFNKLSVENFNYEYDVKIGSGKKIHQSVSLRDLFFYYTMIAHNWERRSNSLIRIFDSFQNDGLIKDFHKYISDLDKSNITFAIEDSIPNDIIPYVARTGSPWRDNGEWMWYRNKKQNARILLKFEGKEEENLTPEQIQQFEDQGFEPEDMKPVENDFGLYNVMKQNKVDNINYFPLNRILGTRNISFEIQRNGSQKMIVDMSYDTKTRKVQKLNVNIHNINGDIKSIPINYDHLVPIKRLNTALGDHSIIIDIDKIEQLVSAKLGGC